MLRRNLLKSLATLIPVSLIPVKLQELEVKPFRTELQWNKSTYDHNGNRLTYENSNGYWSKSTYDKNDNELTFEDSNGCWWKFTFDQYGNQIYCEYKTSQISL